jgi:FPC/CPF motif-containing protein YcgG
MKRSYAFIFLALYVFVCGCRAGSAPTASAPAAAPAAFDANRSFEDLSAQCALGPRVPGTAGHAACLNYIRKQLKLYMDEVSVQPFVWRDPEKKIDVPMTNILA